MFNDIISIIFLIFINIILSMDNAVLIASTTKNLPEKQKKIASMLGALGAFFFRVIFIAILMTIFDKFSGTILIFIVGGFLLIFLGLDLTTEKNNIKEPKAGANIMKASFLIVLGDLMMSLDNSIVLAGFLSSTFDSVALQAIAITITLLISIIVIIFLANKLGDLMSKNKWIVYAGSAILIGVGIEMVLQDALISKSIDNLFVSAGIGSFKSLILFVFSYTIGVIMAILKWHWDKKHKLTEEELKGIEAGFWVETYYKQIIDEEEKEKLKKK